MSNLENLKLASEIVAALSLMTIDLEKSMEEVDKELSENGGVIRLGDGLVIYLTTSILVILDTIKECIEKEDISILKNGTINMHDQIKKLTEGEQK